MVNARCCNRDLRVVKLPYSSLFFAIRYSVSSSRLAISGSRLNHSGGASGFRACNKLILERCVIRPTRQHSVSHLALTFFQSSRDVTVCRFLTARVYMVKIRSLPDAFVVSVVISSGQRPVVA